ELALLILAHALEIAEAVAAAVQLDQVAASAAHAAERSGAPQRAPDPEVEDEDSADQCDDSSHQPALLAAKHVEHEAVSRVGGSAAATGGGRRGRAPGWPGGGRTGGA